MSSAVMAHLLQLDRPDATPRLPATAEAVTLTPSLSHGPQQDPLPGGSGHVTSWRSWSSCRLDLLVKTLGGLARRNAVRVIGPRHRLDRSRRKRLRCIW